MVKLRPDRIERLRLEAGLTQDELAARAHIAVATRRRALRGRRVRIRVARDLAEALGAQLKDILDVEASLSGVA